MTDKVEFIIAFIGAFVALFKNLLWMSFYAHLFHLNKPIDKSSEVE